MDKILFDTDVLIELFRGNQEVFDFISSAVGKTALLAYTPITEAELGHGMRKGEEGPILDALRVFQCLEITQGMGKKAGEYLRKFSKSHAVESADALIAAAAHESGFSLCSFNWKHYPMDDIKKVKVHR